MGLERAALEEAGSLGYKPVDFSKIITDGALPGAEGPYLIHPGTASWVLMHTFAALTGAAAVERQPLGKGIAGNGNVRATFYAPVVYPEFGLTAGLDLYTDNDQRTPLFVSRLTVSRLPMVELLRGKSDFLIGANGYERRRKYHHSSVAIDIPSFKGSLTVLGGESAKDVQRNMEDFQAIIAVQKHLGNFGKAMLPSGK